MTRQGRKWNFDPCTNELRGGDVAPFLSILCNNVQIYGKATEEEPPTFIIKTLVERGAIAYLRDVNMWAAFTPVGRRKRTGLPRMVRLIGDDGRASEPVQAGDAKDANVCIIPANAYMHAPKKDVMDKVATLFSISTALGQNLDALKQTSAVMYDDPEMKSQIDAAEKARLAGASTVAIQKKVGKSIEVTSFSPKAQSYIHDFLELWAQTIEELDEGTGRVKVGEKTERRTDDEITVIENSASASIDVIIDTFNRFCKWYGIEARAVRGVELRENARNDEDGEEDKEAQRATESA